MIDHRTDTALKWEGMEILIKNLGYVDAERFVALMNREPFDYTKWRQSNCPQTSFLSGFEGIKLSSSSVC